jgi:hypothetical protein
MVTRLDRPDRGGVWVEYLRETALALEAEAERLAGPGGLQKDLPGIEIPSAGSVTLLRWDADGEERIMAAALLPHTSAGLEEVVAAVHALPEGERDRLFAAALGVRGNRRHRPGRGFEHTDYTFELVSDFGAFRDLQRHRMLTIQWQELTPALGYAVPSEVVAAGLEGRWRQAVERAEAAWAEIRPELPEQAQYLVTLAHRVRYVIKLNAREALHLIELRTSPQGHPSYRRICQEMLHQIDAVAGHHRVARAMSFAGREDVHLPRYAAEVGRGD